MDYKQIIENNFDLIITSIELIDSHFGTEIYIANTYSDKFIMKKLPLYMESVKNEGHITEFLYNKGIKVARLLKTKNNDFVVIADNHQITVQEFIEGDTLKLNTAPDWFLVMSAEFLGKVNRLLCDYSELPTSFGKEFFCRDTVAQKRQNYENELIKAKENGDINISLQWQEQIDHLNRIVEFCIETDKLTYANSHGDYHIGQTILNDTEITVIDWISACRLPVCLEVITSYVFASPKCIDGVIDVEELKFYISHYTKYFTLTNYDIKMMPYVFYFWHCMCNYLPTEEIPENYKPIAKLILKFLNWLYKNVDELSETLCVK